MFIEFCEFYNDYFYVFEVKWGEEPSGADPILVDICVSLFSKSLKMFKEKKEKKLKSE